MLLLLTRDYYQNASTRGRANFPPIKAHPSSQGESRANELELVVASTAREDVSWLEKYVPRWPKNIYVADNRSSPLTVPENKGHEAMVYLTYIIDNYDSLPDNVLFIHASRFQWHNDDPDYDGLPALQRFQIPYLQAEGYVNLRCVWTIGCPAEIRPLEDDGVEQNVVTAKHVYKEGFQELFPEEIVPEVVAVSCCSQFGVTRETIRRRPRSDYTRFRRWLLDTSLDDNLSGRIFEFSWHIIFGKKAYHCPSAASCYCNVYGLCNLTCSEKTCDGRYALPPFSNLPSGWPKKGWRQEDRHFSGPLDEI